jgi:fatty acyl-CoA reductase
MDSETLDILTPKMVGSRPNTYTFTKSIAETLLKEECRDLPVAIFRPSIVGATYQEPIAVSKYCLYSGTCLIRTRPDLKKSSD